MSNNQKNSGSKETDKSELIDKKKQYPQTKQPVEKLSDEEIRRQLGWYLTEKKNKP